MFIELISYISSCFQRVLEDILKILSLIIIKKIIELWIKKYKYRD
nr:hypothetical protein BAR15_110042 [Bartonella sp. AR 15-3]